jgi:hypothetical protein
MAALLPRAWLPGVAKGRSLYQHGSLIATPATPGSRFEDFLNAPPCGAPPCAELFAEIQLAPDTGNAEGGPFFFERPYRRIGGERIIDCNALNGTKGIRSLLTCRVNQQLPVFVVCPLERPQ